MEDSKNALLSICSYRDSYCSHLNPWNIDIGIQKDTANRIVQLYETEPRAALRDCFPAHLTGSAFVLNFLHTHTALIFHKKIGKWMQPGGHADGDFLLSRVALREAQEETGIADLRFVCLNQPDRIQQIHEAHEFAGLFSQTLLPLPFDTDIHIIPAHGDVSEHWHFDARYLLVAQQDAMFVATDEVGGIEWVPLDRISEWTNEWSVLRMAKKVIALLDDGVKRMSLMLP